MNNSALHIDLLRNEVFVRGKRVHLPKKEFQILAALMRSNVTMSRKELMKVLTRGRPVKDFDSRVVDQHVSRIRAKIPREFIETVSCYGYRYSGNGLV